MGKITPIDNADPQTAKRVHSSYPRYVFGILFAISFLNYLDRFVFAGAANTIASELHLDSLRDVGFLTSAFLIVYTLSTIPLGIWADRSKRTTIVAICVAIWSLATAFTALATNFTTLFLSRMILGIGEGGYFPAGTALLSDYYSRSKRSRVMSLWGTAQLFGILGGFGIGGVLAGLYVGGWRLAFLVTGIPGLLLAFLMWRIREPRRNQADEEAAELAQPSTGEFVQDALSEGVEANKRAPVASSGNLFVQFAALLRVKTLVVLIFMQIFAFFVLGVNTSFLPIYLQQKDLYGLLPGPAGLYSGVIIVVAGGIGTLLGGYLADLLNRRYPGARILVCGIGFLLSAPAFAVAILFHNLVFFTLFFVLTVLLLSIYSGPSTAATQDVTPSRLRASSAALVLLFAHLFGDAFAPSLIGILATLFDPTHGQHFVNHVAGQDMSLALLITCVPALLIAGLIGLFGARWVGSDIAAAEHIDRQEKLAIV